VLARSRYSASVLERENSSCTMIGAQDPVVKRRSSGFPAQLASEKEMGGMVMSVPLRKRRIRLTAMSRSSWEMNMLKDLIHIKCRVG
jgi:hypothetical protein